MGEGGGGWPKIIDLARFCSFEKAYFRVSAGAKLDSLGCSLKTNFNNKIKSSIRLLLNFLIISESFPVNDSRKMANLF